MSFHFFLSATNSLHLITPSTWRSLSTSSSHPFLGLPLLLVPSSSWVKIILGILSSSILSRRPNQLILCPFIHFTIFSPLLISSSSRFVRFFHSPFSYLGPYILLNIFLSKISRACSFFANIRHTVLLFYRSPHRCKCHETPRRMHAFYAITQPQAAGRQNGDTTCRYHVVVKEWFTRLLVCRHSGSTINAYITSKVTVLTVRLAVTTN